MIYDQVKAKGTIEFVLEESNKIVQRTTVNNMIVETGAEYIASRLISSAQVMSHIGIGTSLASVTADDTSLGNEVYRKAFTEAASNPSANVIKYVTRFAPGEGTGEITEAAIFNASSDGVMLAKSTFGSIYKSSAMALTISWYININ